MTSDSLDQEAMHVLSLALDQASDMREQWVEEHYSSRPELIVRVLQLLRRDASGTSALRTGGARSDALDVQQPERAGNYKISELIGQGGMGAVYKAHRDSGDFDHTAAIKIVRPGVLSDQLTARFERERQTLASLNHPAIARLFDGGTLEDGSPYIIMEFVDGVPLGRWVDSANLSLNDLLNLFVQICGAVAYAHQNLIVHRDITPSNVLITKEGAVKLIDFGIAKPQSLDAIGETPDPESLASLSFTPGFAAPERKQGAGANTLSDVFSLGKLLEAILGERDLDDDLRAVISRATAPQLADRYASVTALSDDIESYLSGYPVEAREASAMYRFGKYIRRRRWLVSFGTLAAGALVAAFVVTLLQYQRAETALVHANDRFEQARQLSRSMMTDVYGAMDQVPGTLEARENMAGIVKTYVEELAADPNAPDNVLMDVAVQNTRLSDIFGGLGIANLGDTETSWALLLDAEKALTRLLERNPDDVAAIDEMAWVKRLKANQQLTYQLDVEGARQTNSEGLALAERGLQMPGAEDTRLYFRLWNSRTDHIKILAYENALEDAVAAARQYQIELAESEYDEEPQRRNSRLAYFSRQEGEALSDLQRWEEAIPPLERAIASYDEILATDNSTYYYKLQKLTTIGPLTLSQLNAGRGEDAKQSADDGLNIARDLLSADEEDAGSWGYVATKLEMVARAQSEYGDAAKGLSSIEEGLQIRRRLVADFPETLSHQRDLAGTLKAAGRVYAITSTPERSCGALNEGKSILARLNESESLTDFDRDVWIPEIDGLIEANGC